MFDDFSSDKNKNNSSEDEYHSSDYQSSTEHEPTIELTNPEQTSVKNNLKVVYSQVTCLFPEFFTLNKNKTKSTPKTSQQRKSVNNTSGNNRKCLLCLYPLSHGVNFEKFGISNTASIPSLKEHSELCHKTYPIAQCLISLCDKRNDVSIDGLLRSVLAGSLKKLMLSNFSKLNFFTFYQKHIQHEMTLIIGGAVMLIGESSSDYFMAKKTKNKELFQHVSKELRNNYLKKIKKNVNEHVYKYFTISTLVVQELLRIK